MNICYIHCTRKCQKEGEGGEAAAVVAHLPKQVEQTLMLFTLELVLFLGSLIY